MSIEPCRSPGPFSCNHGGASQNPCGVFAKARDESEGAEGPELFGIMATLLESLQWCRL